MPGNLMRKRSFVSWKTWRRHWCTVRKLGPGLGAEVQLERGLTIDGLNAYRNTIKIPSDSIICRTESRTKSYAFGIFPPPLPPRTRCVSDSSKNGVLSDEELCHEENSKLLTSNTPLTDINLGSSQKILLPVYATSEHSDYVPMSPRPKDFSAEQEKKQLVSHEEDIYMVMR